MKLLKVNICAFRYLFGKEVQGNAYVVFGIFNDNKEKHSLPGSIQRVTVSICPSWTHNSHTTRSGFIGNYMPINPDRGKFKRLTGTVFNNSIDSEIVICCQVVNGRADARLTREQIQETFPAIKSLVKSSIYVAVTVLTESGEWIWFAS